MKEKVTAADSHWQLGRTEIHGKIIQDMLDNVDREIGIETQEQFNLALLESFQAKNALGK